MNSGIVEPIMQAMYLCSSKRPDELEQLVTYAMREDKRHLAWRLVILCNRLRMIKMKMPVPLLAMRCDGWTNTGKPSSRQMTPDPTLAALKR